MDKISWNQQDHDLDNEKEKSPQKWEKMLNEHSSEAVVPAAVPKTPSAADGVSESKKIQAIEYFKKNLHDL